MGMYGLFKVRLYFEDFTTGANLVFQEEALRERKS